MKAFWWGCLFLWALWMHTPVRGQWNIQSAPSTVGADGRPLQNSVLSLQPLVFAREYRKSVQYNNRAECSSTGNVCTGEAVCEAPYFSMQTAIQRLIATISSLAKVTVFVTDTLTSATSSNPINVNSSSLLASESGYTTLAAKTGLTDADYYSMGLKAFAAFHPNQKSAMRRLLQVTQGNFNGDFSGCNQDPEFCNTQIADQEADSAQDYSNQANTLNLGRTNGALNQQAAALVTFTQYATALSSAYQNAAAVGQVDQDQLGGVLDSLGATVKVQQGIAQSANASIASQANSVSSFQSVVTQIGAAMASAIAEEAYLAFQDAAGKAFIATAVAKAQAQLNVYNYFLANQIQMAQLLTSTAANLKSMVLGISNDPNTARLLNTLIFKAKDQYAKIGLFQVTDYNGVPPVVYNNQNKYDTILQGAYYVLVPIVLVLSNGTHINSWTLERMSYALQCDKTQFATNTADQETWTAVSQWYGPDVECANDPVGSCLCRINVQYQHSRHPSVLQYYLTGQVNQTTPAGVTQLSDFPTSALVPKYLQSTLNLLSVGTRPSTVAQGAFANNTFFSPVYESRMLYNLADVTQELQSRLCLQTLVDAAQLPSVTQANFDTAPLGAATPNGAASNTFYARHFPQAQIGDRIPLTSSLTNYQQNNTLAARPFCQADLTTSSQYLSLNIATFFGSLLSNQIRAWKAWVPRLKSVASFGNGVGPGGMKIQSKEFCWQTNHNSINDSFGRCDTATIAFQSPDASPVFKEYGRQEVINCYFIPDPLSVSAGLLPATIPMTGTVVWSAPDLERVIPDYFYMVGYPQCMRKKCPLRVLAMVNNTVMASGGGGYDTYWYTVPRSLMIESPNPMANIHSPLYVQASYHRSQGPTLASIYNTFDGNTTRYPAPTMQDFRQSSRGSLFDPTYMDVSLSDFQQLLDVTDYQVPSNAADGAQPGSWQIISCRGHDRVSTDFEDCGLLELADMQWDLASGNGLLKLYPYKWYISQMLLPLPGGTTISFPAATNGCPKTVSVTRLPLQNAELTITNTASSPVGPFYVQTEGCAPYTGNQTTLATFQTQTVSVPTCDGETIYVLSNSFVTPGQVDTCFEYTVRADTISVATVKQAVFTLATTTRSPILKLSQDNIQLVTQMHDIMAQNATLILLQLLNGQRTQAVVQAAKDNMANLNRTFQQIEDQLAATIFGVNANLTSIQAQIQQIQQEVPLLFQVNAAEQAVLSILLKDQAIYQQVTAIANQALAQYAAGVAKLALVTSTLSPYNYYFSSLPSNYNWSDPSPSTFIQTVLDNGCLTLFQVPPSPPDGSTQPCNFGFAPWKWFNCINGPWIGARYMIYCLMFEFILTASFLTSLMIPKFYGKYSKTVHDNFSRVCQCRFPNIESMAITSGM